MHLRERFNKKTANYPHFVDKHFTPPPLSTSAEVNNIHTKEFLLSTFADPHPPRPLSTFIDINNIFLNFYLLIFLIFFLDYD